MRRLPIRLRVAAVSAVAMLVLLVAAGAVVYVRLRIDLDDRIDDDLRTRADRISARVAQQRLADLESGDPEETLMQLLTADGRLVESVGGKPVPVSVSALSPAQASLAARHPVLVETRVEGLDGRIRLLARPAAGDGPDRVVVVGRSLVDRDEALASVVRSFGIGGVLALSLTSASGFLIARAGLAPVEAMRRRAREVSLTPGGPDLPLPGADDEIRRLGETLNEMLARLRESFARESRFVADASHELRTPVAVIKTELEAAVQAGDHGPATRESLLAALEECDRLGQLAEDLLLLARTTDGRLPVRCGQVRVDQLVCGVRDRFVARAGERGREITVAADVGTAWLDPDRVRQALSNLVDNALRHGAGVVRVDVRRAGSAVEVDVHDDGPGFPEDFVHRAFERFSRADPARTGDGAGLGLAIVATIAAAHGGAASVVPGAGCTVRLRLPAVEPAAHLH